MTAAQERTYMDYSRRGYNFHSKRPDGTVAMVKREGATTRRIAIKTNGSVVEDTK